MKESITMIMTHEQARLVWIVISNHAMGSSVLQQTADQLEQLLTVSEMPKQSDQ